MNYRTPNDTHILGLERALLFIHSFTGVSDASKTQIGEQSRFMRNNFDDFKDWKCVKVPKLLLVPQESLVLSLLCWSFVSIADSKLERRILIRSTVDL